MCRTVQLFSATFHRREDAITSLIGFDDSLRSVVLILMLMFFGEPLDILFQEIRNRRNSPEELASGAL